MAVPFFLFILHFQIHGGLFVHPLYVLYKFIGVYNVFTVCYCCFLDSALRLTYMYTHCKATHAHVFTCLMHVLATVSRLFFIAESFVGQLIVASRAYVCAHCSSKSSTCACACSSLFGEAVSMSERSERILTISEALVLC